MAECTGIENNTIVHTRPLQPVNERPFTIRLKVRKLCPPLVRLTQFIPEIFPTASSVIQGLARTNLV